MKYILLFFFISHLTAGNCQYANHIIDPGDSMLSHVKLYRWYSYARQDTINPFSISETQYDSSGKCIYTMHRQVKNETSREYFYSYSGLILNHKTEKYIAYKLRQIKDEHYDERGRVLYMTDSLWIRGELWSAEKETYRYDADTNVRYYEKRSMNDSLIYSFKYIDDPVKKISTSVNLISNDTTNWFMDEYDNRRHVEEILMEIDRIKYRHAYPQTKYDTLYTTPENYIIRYLRKENKNAEWVIIRNYFYSNGLLRRDEMINGGIAIFQYEYF